MRFLINASNLKVGGGIQVADSICCNLGKFEQHEFVVVLSFFMSATAERLERSGFANVQMLQHDIRNDFNTIVRGRDDFMDSLVKEMGIQAVLTVFGPSRWIPRCLHLCGFASAQLLLQDSPYYTRGLIWKLLLKENVRIAILKRYYKLCSKNFYTENPYISEKLKVLLPDSEVFTVTNYYNQIYDHPDQWKERALQKFTGITLLTVTAAYPHKNLPIAIDVARTLKQKYPDFKFRFVLTIDEIQFPPLEDSLKPHFVFIGRVDISECPSLYRQCKIMFQPTLLECFSATYPEAMKMERPIVTTDIEFARGLCGTAAVYYSPLSAEDAAMAIYRVATDEILRQSLIEAGKKQLLQFDTYEKRTEKLIGILEHLVNKKDKNKTQ